VEGSPALHHRLRSAVLLHPADLERWRPVGRLRPLLVSGQPAAALVQPYRAAAGAPRIGRNPVTGELLPAATIGTFAGAGTPFQGMAVFDERILETPSIKVGPRAVSPGMSSAMARRRFAAASASSIDRFNDDQILQLVELLQHHGDTAPRSTVTIADLLSPSALTSSGMSSASNGVSIHRPSTTGASASSKTSVGEPCSTWRTSATSDVTCCIAAA
jgi:hypothetical protein